MTSTSLLAITGDAADFSVIFSRVGLRGDRDNYGSNLSSRAFEPSRFGTLRFVLADRARGQPQ